MAASHKFQHANVEVISSLPAEKLLAIAQDVVPGIKQLNMGASAHDGFGVTVKSWAKIPIMEFTVTAATQADGTTRVVSEITHFLTQQSKVFIFIPVGPKELLGYGQYKEFMRTYADAVRAIDPSARATVTERVIEAA